MHYRVVSYGGGRQTAALAVLAATGRLGKVDAIVFADTGRELPHTYKYNQIIDGWLSERGMTLHVARPSPRGAREGEGETLSGAISRRAAVLPMYGSRGGMMKRRCTERFKIRVVRQWMRRRGASTAEVLLGISTDEWHRAKDADVKWAANRFPLLDLGLSADDCVRIVQEAGLPAPERSACDCCPHRTLAEWRLMRDRYPGVFAEAVEVEASYPGLFLHAGRKPLPVLLEHPAADDPEDGCTSGYCFV
jgi:hypothetical protein